MKFDLVGSFLLGVLAFMLPVAQARVCLVMYQMADNNLEYYLRQDYEELTNSGVIRSGDVRLWVYYDALNQGGDPLPNTLGINGSPLTGTFTGSRYLSWDQSAQTMRVMKELPGEQNSDTQDVIESFLVHAFNDCKQSGFESLFAIFSSHGGGFAGYGGDENSRRLLSRYSGGAYDDEKSRKLLQTNQGIVSAIEGALATTGAGDMLDVIGFDACLMQAVGAADDYKDVARYILASEAVEPGHGWAYTYLESADTALDLAQQILDTFVEQKQGGSHQSPKTMAILDTAMFVEFIEAFESFSADLLTNLMDGDVSLHTFISRARSKAVAFEGIVDVVGSQNPSGLDIGSFLEEFQKLCNPGGLLGSSLNAAMQAYDGMFVDVKIGAGTAKGTGMHITWPNQGEFTQNQALWKQVLFNNKNYVTTIIPNFREFLEWFLPSGTPSGNGDSTICGATGIPQEAPSNPNDLIISDTGTKGTSTDSFHVDAEISQDVSQVMVEYGLDLSTPLKPVLIDRGYEPRDDDYLYLLGGDVAGVYDGSKYSASWDQNFYFLNITGSGTFEALYTFDQGDGSKKIPAMYFPPDKREEVANLKFLDFLFFDFEYWVDNGARFSFLMFSVDEADGRVNDNLSLYTANLQGAFSEQPRSAGGLLIPLIYIDAYIQGRKLDTLPGGFNQTVIEWTSDLDYNILTVTASRVFEVIPDADACVLNMYAFDHGKPNKPPDARYYDVIRPNKGSDFTLVEDGADEFISGSSVCSSAFALAVGLATLVYGAV